MNPSSKASEQQSNRPRVFSGIQPSGELHLGNYFGAVKNWVELQHSTDSVYCLVDLHALSVPREPGQIAANTIEVATDLLAAGIDPNLSTLFVQSTVKEHTELAWHLQCVAGFGELRRMTQFKDKSDSNDFVSAALFTYPALQAADIVLYDTDIVPVGEDQVQHIEFTRDVVNRFNSRFGETLVLPAARIPTTGARVMDLQVPTNKMSKSTDSPQGCIMLSDDDDTIVKKIKRAVTDNDGEVRYDQTEKPGVSNLLSLLSIATAESPLALADKYSQYGPLKSDTAEALVELLSPIRQRRSELDEATVRTILAEGTSKASEIAGKVMERVRLAVALF